MQLARQAKSVVFVDVRRAYRPVIADLHRITVSVGVKVRDNSFRGIADSLKVKVDELVLVVVKQHSSIWGRGAGWIY